MALVLEVAERRILIPIVTSEHASRDLPSEPVDLGVSDDVLESHAAWDPGAKEVAEHVAAALGAPLFVGRYTRLFVDLNRSPDSEAAIPAVAFGVSVPGNAGLTAAERAERIESHHAPYWRSVALAVERALATPPAEAVVHVSVHSFVEELAGRRRTLDLGILFDPEHPLEREVSAHLLETLPGSGFDVRLNEPYDGRSDGLTTAYRKRFPPDRYAGIEVEISQRLLSNLDGVARALATSLASLVRRAK